MTLRHMTIFVSVHEAGSITKAATALHLAQPSVSQAIKELENYYGISLFDRIGRGIRPTESGKAFYNYALHIVSLFNEMEQTIKNWDSMGIIRIGASITIGTHILPLIIKAYEHQYPNLEIKVIIRQSAAIEQLILEDKIDIALIEAQPKQADILSVPFMEDELCAIVPPNHPLLHIVETTLVDMAQYPFLMRESGSAGRQILEACFELQDIHIQPRWESTSTQAIVKAVSVGLGVAVLPYLLVQKDIEEGNVCQIMLAHPLKRHLNIIYHKNKFLTENMKAFIALCKDIDKLNIHYKF